MKFTASLSLHQSDISFWKFSFLKFSSKVKLMLILMVLLIFDFFFVFRQIRMVEMILITCRNFRESGLFMMVKGLEEVLEDCLGSLSLFVKLEMCFRENFLRRLGIFKEIKKGVLTSVLLACSCSLIFVGAYVYCSLGCFCLYCWWREVEIVAVSIVFRSVLFWSVKIV